MKVLLIDNYDSFTYNLVHYLEKSGAEVVVYRNDAAELAHLELAQFDGLVLSPGPGLPEDSGQLMSFIQRSYGQLPILGVCLGMQALALHTGGRLYN
ncbi:gamma-glutamyl-gamma-aminobutyrate hydrolase family protein, partial [Schleiferiaceae bacterium]|nr:gamma-glutamyl-gamma-aminobutyrate hydrolase family protein [Schleiferiaceae bacterium]